MESVKRVQRRKSVLFCVVLPVESAVVQIKIGSWPETGVKQ